MYRALHSIDRTIEKIIPEICNDVCFYCEVGANDGLNQSNTYFLEKKYGARGMLIEPIPFIYEQLIKNRSSENIFENYALVPSNYEIDTVVLNYCNLMSTTEINDDYDLGDLTLEDHAVSGLRFVPDDEITKITVGATDFTSLAKKHDVDRVTIFFLDVEGNEMNVLSGIDLKNIFVQYFVIETRNLERVTEYLEKFGYDFVAKITIHDYVFKRRTDF